jgi:hypothetical protein
MTALEILKRLNTKDCNGLQLTKRSGLLSSTWLLYKKEGHYFYFDISEQISFDMNHMYTDKEWADDFSKAYFTIDLEVA